MIKQTEEAICPDLPVIPEYTVTITDHGAVGDGVYDNTQAFHQAIEACAKAGGEGGHPSRDLAHRSVVPAEPD